MALSSLVKAAPRWEMKAVLKNDFGLDLTGWHLIEARDISPDG